MFAHSQALQQMVVFREDSSESLMRKQAKEVYHGLLYHLLYLNERPSVKCFS